MSIDSFQFGPFTFDTHRRCLLKAGTAVEIGQKALVLLETLLAARGRVVPKADLLNAAWETEHIEESNLAVQIAALRKALGLTRHGDDWIQTVQRVGYRFVDPDKASEQSLHNLDRGVEIKADKPSLAVLPFLNLSSDPEQDYFSDGFTSDLITELARWRLLAVRSRTASFQYRRQTPDLKRIASELKINYIVEGSVRRLGQRVRISAQLIDVESGNQVWSEKFDRDANDIFDVQDQVVRTIVSTLVGRVVVASVQQANRKPPTQLAAYECMLKGNSLPWKVPSAAIRARELFAKAIEIDPDYAQAHALLAIMLAVEWSDDLDCDDAKLKDANALAMRAVDLDNTESTCFSILAMIQMRMRDFESAQQNIRHSLALNPNNQWNVADLGIIETYLGNAERGLEHFKRAREIDPYFNPQWYGWRVGQACYSLGRYQEALAHFEASTELSFERAAYMAACFAQLRHKVEAARLRRECLELNPNFTLTKFVAKNPFSSPSDVAHLIEGLRMAGLPE